MRGMSRSLATALILLPYLASGLAAQTKTDDAKPADPPKTAEQPVPQPAPPPAATPEPPLEVPSLARVEWEHINRVLAECGGNISKAARLLGLQRRSLQRKLAKYPVRR